MTDKAAALPDVRALRDPKRFGVEALIAVAEGRYANIPDGTVLRPGRLTNAFLDGAQYVLAALEAALRSREGERAEPEGEALRAMRLGCEECGYVSDIPRGYGVPRATEAAQPEEAAQRATEGRL